MSKELETLEIIKERNLLFKKIRNFFDSKGYLEVDTPLLTQYPASEANIEPIEAFPLKDNQPYYLICSAEYNLKRLIAYGSGPIYQLSSVFRRSENGRMHAPEFTMLEWYALKSSYQDLIQETAALLKLTLAVEKLDYISYQDCFKRHLNLDPLSQDSNLDRKLTSIVQEQSYTEIDPNKLDLHEKLDFIFSFKIQPYLGLEKPLILFDYPIDIGSLAEPNPDNKSAQRFEAFYKGVELCNGYRELSHPAKIKSRMQAVEVYRHQKLKKQYPLDKNFIADLKNPLPVVAGTALGVDRLLALILAKSAISCVRPFALDYLE